MVDKRRKYYMVLDVETAGGFDNPLVYDIGYTITDKSGKIYLKKSFIIKEIFKGRYMKTAYYKEKIPMYKKMIKEGAFEVISFLEMRNQLLTDLKTFNVKTISAYNLNFDKNALSNTMKHITGYSKFLTLDFKDINLLDIWGFACEVLFTQKSFKTVAKQQNWVSPAGNMRTSAEIGYRYITHDYDFVESHTGLDDAIIETQILSKCLRQKKKYTRKIMSHPWKIPNQK